MKKLLRAIVEQTDKNLIAHLKGLFFRPKISPLPKRQYLFTSSEAAKFLGVSADTLRNWETLGKVTSQRTKGGSRRFTLSELNKLVSQHGNKYKVLKNISNNNFILQKIIPGKVIPIKLITTVGISAVAIASLIFLGLVIRPQAQHLGGETKEVLGISDEEIESSIESSLDINIPTNINADLTVKGKVVADELTALNLNTIFSLTASDGISVTLGQKPTIKNTGVLSLQSTTGALTLAAGTGITIDGLKITTSAKLSDIRTNGGCSSCITDDDVASGLTISGGSVNNSPIGASTASTGAFTTLSASSTLAITGAVTASSTLAVTGATTLNGNVTLGDASTDTVTFTGRVSSNIVPSSSDTYTLGTSSLPWSQLYLSGVSTLGGQSTFTAQPTGTGVGNGSIYINPSSVSDSSYTLFGIAVGGIEKLRMDATGNITVQGNLVGPTGGSIGYWSRSGALVYPYTIGDTIGTFGNVGVGTTAAPTNLYIKGSGASTGVNLLTQNFNQTNFGLAVLDNGNVGIGTTNPGTALDVRGNITLLTGYDIRPTADSITALNIANAAGTDFVTFDTTNSRTGIGTASPGSRLTVIGNVGIGTSAAGAQLQVNGGGLFGWGTTSVAAPANGLAVSGNVGIGTSSPQASLDVNSTNTQFRLSYDGTYFATESVSSAGALTIDTNSTGAINIGTGSNAKTVTIGNGTTSSALALTSGTGSQTFASSVATTFTTSSAWVFTDTALTTGTGMYLNSGSTNNLSSGNLLYLASTSTALTTGSMFNSSYTGAVGSGWSGGLNIFDYSPSSAPSTSPTGDLLRLSLGTNATNFAGNIFNILDNSSSVFSISKTAVTTSLPFNETAPGDVSIAYDIAFSNPTASFIKSDSNLSIVAGESFNSSNLTLATYNSGQIVLDAAGGVVLSQYQPWQLSTSSTMAWNIQDSSGNNLLSFDTTNQRVGVGTTGPVAVLNITSTTAVDLFRVDDNGRGDTSPFVVDQVGNVGIANSAPSYNLDIVGNLRNSTGAILAASSGNVGVGTVNPGSKFSVIGNVGIGTSAAGAALSVNGGGLFGWGTASVAGPSNGLAVQGNVGVGTTTANSKLTVIGGATVGADYGVYTAPTNGLLVQGNVGIGTSNGTGAFNLDVAGTGRFSSTLSLPNGSATTPALNFANLTNAGLWQANNIISLTNAGAVSGLAINSSGNVGVGTTSPAGNLHVVGQCVAEGTRIRRRRKNSNGEWEEEEINVEDIAADDEVLSLDDQTGQWEWKKVEATLNKGIQTVYRLETESGKWIETTSNHPYLVRELTFGGRLFEESNIGQQSHNHGQGKSYSNFSINVNKINHLFNPFLNLIAVNKQTIANMVLAVNNPILSNRLPLENGTPKAMINQPADKLISRSDNATAVIESNLFTLNSISQAKWIKISQIKNGQYIATLDGWEQITAITKVGRKQTYDLQIAGTHNFVGNNIVAHNTYISGNLGIGFTSPNQALQVASAPSAATSLANILGANGSQLSLTGNTASTTLTKLAIGMDTTNNFGYLQAGSNGSASNLILEPNGGNVGIGTTSPAGALHVVGQCVSWDTRIRVRRRRRGYGAQGEDDEIEYDYLEVMIKDILEGDEVLSLNEVSGQFEYQAVEKLLDMGTKGVYELVTKSGKRIKTTSEHPYLVKEVLNRSQKHHSSINHAGWIKVTDLKVEDQIAVAGLSAMTGFSFPVFDHQDYGNNTQNENYSSNPKGVNNLIHRFFPFLTNHTAAIKPTIAATPFIVNNFKNATPVRFWDSAGTMGMAASQVADRLVSNPDRVSSISLSLPSFINQTDISTNQTVFQWDTITSIEYLGYEHVYDLQISNTHNFVGNNIVAHNTYINGSIGIGTNFTGVTTPTNGLAVQGNIGIGTTTANSKLTVIGGATVGADYGVYTAPTNGLLVQGNVGIGTSVSSNPLTVGVDGSTGNGAYLSAGGTWTNGSSFEFKENFESLNSLDILSKINLLNISSWNYKLEPDVKHIGPIAEQFYSIFGLGNDNKHISTIDPAGVALIGIKGLSQEISNLKSAQIASSSANEASPSSTINSLSSAVNNLKDQIASLSARLATLEAQRVQIKEATNTASPSAQIASSSANEASPSSTISDTLKLTDPSILLATGSAKLTQTSLEVSEATISGMLKAYNLNISDSLKVFGETTLGKTIIAGDLTVDGMLSIENGSELNVLGTLYLQKSSLAKGLDIFNGKVKIDNLGNINTQGEIVTKKLTVSSDSAGTGIIPAGKASVEISSQSVTANSKIFVTPKKVVLIAVTDQNPISHTFTVELDSPKTFDVKFDWWIVDSILEEVTKSPPIATSVATLNTNYLLPTTHSPVPSWQDPGDGVVEITDSTIEFVRVRERPGTDFAEITKIHPGTVFNILMEQDGWIKIEYQPDVYGWIKGSLVNQGK